MKNLYTFLALLLVFSSCKNEPSVDLNSNEEQQRTLIEMTTTKGTMQIALYNETPKHRDNFVKLVNDGTLDSLLFHRVIEDFMVQGGDISSKHASANDTLGNGELDYRVDAEFHPDLFHKRGVLAAARDGNPERASSSTQFYLVHRGPRNDSLIDVDQKRINGWLAEHYIKKDSTYSGITEALNNAMENKDWEHFQLYNDSIKAIAKEYTKYEKYTIPEAHRDVYRSLGGTPHLDQNYTVFGEVIEGLNVIDSIATVATSPLDRPIEDVRILKVRLISKNY